MRVTTGTSTASPTTQAGHDVRGVTPEKIADAHNRDVEIQEKHGVRYHTYWFDPANGSVFRRHGSLP